MALQSYADICMCKIHASCVYSCIVRLLHCQQPKSAFSAMRYLFA